MIDNFNGENTYLSNFFMIPVEFGGIVWPSSENAYQAAKCADIADREKFRLVDASSSKRLGKKVKLRPDWESIKVEMMERIVKSKFKQNPELAQKLVDTGDAELVECNWWGDTFWGVCKGQGQNMLGKILMKVRNELHS